MTEVEVTPAAAEDCPKSQYHHGNLRVALIEAGLATLREEGIGALGLRGVARRAGVSQTAPYHHFGSKDGLFAAVAAEGFRRLAVAQGQATAGSPATEAEPDREIRALGLSYVRFARANPELYRLMFGSLIEDREAFPELVEAYRAGYQTIEDATARFLAKAGSRDVSVKMAVSAAWVVVHGLSYLLNDGKIRPGEEGLPDEDELVHSMMGLVRGGIQGWIEEAKVASGD